MLPDSVLLCQDNGTVFLLEVSISMLKNMFVIGLGLGLVACGGSPDTSKSAQAADNTPPVEVSANDLLNAYKDNEVAANSLYKDKKLMVSGTIDSIEAGLDDKPYLTLKAGGEMEFNQPQAHIADSDVAKAAQLKKGQKVKLLCTGNSEVAGTPMLDDCVIQ